MNAGRGEGRKGDFLAYLIDRNTDACGCQWTFITRAVERVSIRFSARNLLASYRENDLADMKARTLFIDLIFNGTSSRYNISRET